MQLDRRTYMRRSIQGVILIKQFDKMHTLPYFNREYRRSYHSHSGKFVYKIIFKNYRKQLKIISLPINVRLMPVGNIFPGLAKANLKVLARRPESRP